METALWSDNRVLKGQTIRLCFTMGTQMDRFDHMRVFAKIAEIGSFAGAAARLDISPSMASQHVKVLEESLGARLLDRTTRKDTGETYYQDWLATLGRMVTAKGLADAAALNRTREAWDRAARRTLHGAPIELRTGDFSECLL